MRAFAAALALLTGSAWTQEPRFNLVLPPQVACEVVVWNGEPALVLLAPESAPLAAFLDPTLTTPRMGNVQLRPLALAVLDTRPCTAGARFELWFGDRHVPELGGTLPPSGFVLGTSGFHAGVPLSFRAEQPVLTSWYVSYCSMLWCTSSCTPAARIPQWTGLLASIRIL